MASIKLKGDTSGEVIISAPSVAGNTTLELPATSSTLATQNSLGLRNLIINGDMRIDQRNNGASVAINGNTYSLDRIKNYATQTSKFTIQQNAGGVTPPAGFSNYIGATSSSAYTTLAADYFLISQPIEGLNSAHLNWGTANAKTVTLSFWTRSSLTGTFGGNVGNQDGTRSYPFTYTIDSANTWEYKTVTIEGETSGTWLETNAIGIMLYFSLGSGTTFSGTAGAWAAANLTSATGATSVVGTSGATLYITGVQLEADTTATPFEHLQYTTQLQLCQRYFFRPASGSLYGGNYGSGSFISGIWAVEMRAAPTITYTATRTPLIGLGYGYTTATALNAYVSASGYVSGLQANSEL